MKIITATTIMVMYRYVKGDAFHKTYIVTNAYARTTTAFTTTSTMLNVLALTHKVDSKYLK